MWKVIFRPALSGLILILAEFAPASAATPTPFFDNGTPDGKMAMASRPAGSGKIGIEAADDFIVSSTTAVGSVTFTGLVTGTSPTIGRVRVEIYRVFPLDSVSPPDGRVPTRTNSPSDVAFVDRDTASSTLTFVTTTIASTFTAANSVLNGINPIPNQKTGGEGPVTGSEVQFKVTFSTPVILPANHYFFVPQVQVTGGEFYWLSSPKPNTITPFSPDLQAWIRNDPLDPDWLRVGTDIVGGTTPPTFNGSFTLSGRSTVAHDFDGDGKSDILWRNTNGDTVIWFMNGGQVVSTSNLGNVSTAWHVVGTGDFDADGHTDLLWRNDSGDAAIWFLNGIQVVSGSSLGNVPAAWSVAGVGDFDGDGKADILWRNTSGDVVIWFMNGGQIVLSSKFGNVSTDWWVAGVGDFDGDGKADILWRNSNGDAAIWLINGGQIASGAGLGNVPTSWMVAGVRDFGGDGKADILWRNTNGDATLWTMNGTQIAGGQTLGNIPTGWSVVQTTDFNGGGQSDILWRNINGDLSMWLMNGAQIVSGIGLGNVPTDWSVQNVNVN